MIKNKQTYINTKTPRPTVIGLGLLGGGSGGVDGLHQRWQLKGAHTVRAVHPQGRGGACGVWRVGYCWGICIFACVYKCIRWGRPG